jgi:hypothetical protein
MYDGKNDGCSIFPFVCIIDPPISISQEIIDWLKTYAQKKALYDNEMFMVDDYAGGNIDDAYSMGCDDGEIGLARDILYKLGISIGGEN